MHEIIGFPIARDPAARLRDVAARLRTADDAALPRRETAELVIQIMTTGLDFHFRRPVRALGAGSTLRRVVDMAVHAGTRAAGGAIRRVMRGLSPEQMRYVADYLEEAAHRVPAGAPR